MKRQIRQNAPKSDFVGLSIVIGVGFLFGAVPSHALETRAVPTSIISNNVSTTGQVELKGDAKKIPNELDGVGVKEHLGDAINLDLEFTASDDGQKHKLREYFVAGKPTLLNLVYFDCPMLCTMVLNGVTDGLQGLNWSVGKEFNVVTISINPKDDIETAKAKRETYIEHYVQKIEGVPNDHSSETAHAGWHFFTASEDQVKTLANQLGFEYKYDQVQQQYAHPAVTFILTPEGKISRYLYGITYRPHDLRLALMEASQGKIGNVFDRMLMFCYHYEPSTRGYTLQVTRIMKAGGAITVALLMGYLLVFWTRQRKGKRNEKAPTLIA